MLYIIFAVLALSFLIFIHELGHYFMAHRVGMRVETFSIGFGKPIFAWKWGGEQWQICWLLLGGFVKIAGMDEEPNRDPYTVPDGFFGKPPIDRIKVALMGPIVNLVFALFVFSFIWVDGGREKNFSEYTHKIGWIDQDSELYRQGVRPGDEIASYNNHLLRSSAEHVYAPMINEGSVTVKGWRVNYETGERTPFQMDTEPYPHPFAPNSGQMTLGVLSPANYIIYDKLSSGDENPLFPGSPLQDSGIRYGDRIVWVDGVDIYSAAQLNHVINQGLALVTIDRKGEVLLRRVPRVKVQELRLDPLYQEELTDWQFEAGLNDIKLRDLYTIPYDLTPSSVVERRVRLLDEETEKQIFPAYQFSEIEEPLQEGDRIIAVDGQPIQQVYELLQLLQQSHVMIIVARDPAALEKVDWIQGDRSFDQSVDVSALQAIARTIGTDHLVTQEGNFYLLNPVTPKVLQDFELPAEKREKFETEWARQRERIALIEDPERRNQAMMALEKQEKRLLIGVPNIQDRRLDYNPIPTDLFYDVFDEIKRTLTALVSGSLSPKFVTGPIGIVSVVKEHTASDIKDGLFWVGVISLNLGILNLLPIPMLDGGTIVFSLFEMVTGRRLSLKVMERMILPFAALLIGFFLFVTYHDISRLVSQFWM